MNQSNTQMAKRIAVQGFHPFGLISFHSHFFREMKEEMESLQKIEDTSRWDRRQGGHSVQTRKVAPNLLLVVLVKLITKIRNLNLEEAALLKILMNILSQSFKQLLGIDVILGHLSHGGNILSKVQHLDLNGEYPNWTNFRNKEWDTASKIDCDGESHFLGSCSDRTILDLPLKGPLKIEEVKTAFRFSALKWHPDKHQGPSQAMAEEKFKHCVDAYKSLCNALASS